ncbi:ABC transporter permease [Bacillus thuringiensis]|uniref:ABC transporter permease n=3 Tax=Bacillus cereus group TaxID=86661 RepID=A0A9W7Q372_BACCE|nr:MULTISPECIES: ABC transporter permease [Bacillus]AXR15321.1 ABC transporter permease [Bacillus sp. CR71]AXR21055.1 ABC transporter permease [Bacillus sp. E25]KAA6460819.1 ABC transporter permease [Bacillus cereus]KAB2392667.1 ABC transporter permease [Bacillus cereus]KAB2419011.1 ABC transporter permease [Bacillus cereus]
MSTQLKYALEDIWRKKLYFILFFTQIMIITLLITECFSLMYKKQDAFNYLSKTFDISNVYYVSLAEKEKYVGGEYEESIMKDLYTYVNENEKYTIFSDIEDYIEIKGIPQNSLSVEIEQGQTKVQAYKSLAISHSFIDVFDLALSKGEFFDSDWEYTSNESIPVVLGHSYQKFMNINDEFVNIDNLKYKVVGFLQEGQSFVDISSGKGVIELDDTVLIPMDVTKFDDMYVNGNYAYETYLENATIITKNKNDITELRNITEKSRLYNYNFNNVGGVSKYMEMSTKKSVGVFLFISIWVIIFAFSLVIINTLEFVRKNLREFSIHIFCGGNRSDIALRIFLQIFIVWILASIISVLVSNQPFIVLGVSGAILFLCLITCIPSFIKLFSLQISDILRRKE